MSFVEGALGEALGRLYVERHFPPAAKERMDQLVANLLRGLPAEHQRAELDERGHQGQGAGQAGRVHPEDRLPGRVAGLLHAASSGPTTWSATSAAAGAFELDRQLAKIGQPVDRDEWFMTPQTVNAYYNPGMNEIVFPAAILQPPFFDPDADDAVNYGAIGAVIGHEIGHGFDDQGSKYDGRGALQRLVDRRRPGRRSRQLTGKLIEQYSALDPAQAPGQHVNGALTVGENIGDLGGLAIALPGVARSRWTAGDPE